MRFMGLHNLSDHPVNIPMPEDGSTFRNALDLDRPFEVQDGYLELPPYGYCWLIVE
jgi:hypothetical protein